jgi:NAD+ synthase
MELVKRYIVYCLQRKFDSIKDNFPNAIIGISGGVDSAVVAGLCVEALSKDRVKGLILPYSKVITSKTLDVEYAEQVCKHFGISYEVYHIDSAVNAILGLRPVLSNSKFEKLREGNAAARARMAILFDYAAVNRGVVVGTTNYTEYMFGYYTIGGDNIAIIEPIIGLLKTEVFELAKHIGVPEAVINRKPSASLWDGQTDEEELGFTYKELDEYLKNYRSPEIHELARNASWKRNIPFKITREELLGNSVL